ncbi:MAG: hypothetical protein QOH43_1577 [Solirubrobacteraceae bacterium]|jgi:hypothetical protein|nr:hypothetical protein [Solirubrobacteraceae bacterium]
MRMLLPTAVVVGLLLAPATAGAVRRPCPGSVQFAGTPTKIVLLRGVTCLEAGRVLRAYDRRALPRGWSCAMTHAPFDFVGGRIVGLVCGSGKVKDLRKRGHAFLGTVAADPAAAG